MNYDALLVVAFGGPETKDEVIPFLENVLRGRNVPRERMLEVAEHYYHLGGASPINDQVRALIDVLQRQLDEEGISLPIYWGNRNWHPLLADTLQRMTDDGVQRAQALVLSAFGSYSSCRQYRQDIERARETVGPKAPPVDKTRLFYNHPDFVAANAAQLSAALERVPPPRREGALVAFTAHSIPCSYAENCDYENQLRETCRLVAETLQIDPQLWKLVYQSRSGRPSNPWLEPDICDYLRDLKNAQADVIVMPIGFLSDHAEVLYDLDVEAATVAGELGINMIRAATVGTHPRFVRMLCDLIGERLTDSPVRPAIGRHGPSGDDCPADCCKTPNHPAAAPRS
jgi:ferrochelatase